MVKIPAINEKMSDQSMCINIPDIFGVIGSVITEGTWSRVVSEDR